MRHRHLGQLLGHVVPRGSGRKQGTAMNLLAPLLQMLPAYAANMSAPFARFWPGWNRPINERHLGAHKTVVGFALGVAAGVGAAYAQSRLAWLGGSDPVHWFALGLAQGFGAMAGDSVKSYFKRRAGIAPGRRWIPADQLDFIAGALLLAGPWLRLSAWEVVLVLAFTLGAHIAVNHVAFALRIRDTAW
jgi:CDP-2,3-bis-(O-geranylgeranyl)-sn-glycerol synthase